MPKLLPQEVRDAIKTHLLDGKLNHLQIADEVGASLQSVKKYSANLRVFKDILPPRMSAIGRKPLLTKEMVNVCYVAYPCLKTHSNNPRD
jgi:hypothetical protein